MRLACNNTIGPLAGCRRQNVSRLHPYSMRTQSPFTRRGGRLGGPPPPIDLAHGPHADGDRRCGIAAVRRNDPTGRSFRGHNTQQPQELPNYQQQDRHRFDKHHSTLEAWEATGRKFRGHNTQQPQQPPNYQRQGEQRFGKHHSPLEAWEGKEAVNGRGACWSPRQRKAVCCRTAIRGCSHIYSATCAANTKADGSSQQRRGGTQPG